MLQKFNFLIFIGLFLALCQPLNGKAPMVTPFASPNLNCQLPSPQNLQAGSVGPTSIQLLWNPPAGTPPGITVTYKIAMFDLTSNIALADAYTTATDFLYDGLTPGHWYLASVSAGACGVNGPTGPSATIEVQTGIIIVDDIAQLEIPAGTECQFSQQPQLSLAKGAIVLLNLPAFTPPATSGYGPFGKIRVETKEGVVWVELALLASTGNQPVMMEIGSEGVEKNPPGFGQFSEISYIRPGEFEFFRLFDPHFNYQAPTDVHVRLECLEDCVLWYCGLSIISQDSEFGRQMAGQAADSEMSGIINQISIVPNPASGACYIDFNLEEDAPVGLRIENLLGESVYSMPGRSNPLAKGMHRLYANLSHLPKGMYRVTIETPKQRTQKMLVKQ